MRKGLVAQWRRSIATRGVAAAALLAVPVATAGVIGFSGDFGGVTGGLSSLASGPGRTVAEEQDRTSAPRSGDGNAAVLDLARTPSGGSGGGGGSATPPGGGGGDPGSPDGSGTFVGGGGGGSTGTGGGSTTGGGTGSGGSTGGSTGGGSVGGLLPDSPSAPSAPGSGDGPVSQVVEGVTDTVGGLLGGK